MANVRLLRQLVRDYQNRVEKVNEEYDDQRGIYEQAVDGYNAKVASYNTALKAGALIEDMGDGTYQYRNTSGALINGKVITKDALVPSERYKGVWDIPSLGKNGGYVFLDLGDGRAAMYGRSSLGYGVKEKAPLVTKPGEAPTAPEMGDPGRLNLTEKEKGLLQNPTYGPAEMNMATSRGVAATSSLAGDTPTTANSAFANPEDPNNLKEKGVLARVLGGQL